MPNRISKSSVLSFVLLALGLWCLKAVEAPIYQRWIEPIVIWLAQNLYVLGACAVGGFLEISCWLPLGWMAGCFMISLLAVFAMAEWRYPLYWLCPVVCFLLGWFQLHQSVVIAICCYVLPSVLGILVSLLEERRKKKAEHSQETN